MEWDQEHLRQLSRNEMTCLLRSRVLRAELPEGDDRWRELRDAREEAREQREARRNGGEIL